MKKVSDYYVKSSHRYNYWGLDLFREERCEKTILAGLKRKDAEILEGEINSIITKVHLEKACGGIKKELKKYEAT